MEIDFITHCHVIYIKHHHHRRREAAAVHGETPPVSPSVSRLDIGDVKHVSLYIHVYVYVGLEGYIILYIYL
jgi:hypothetical protein